MNKKTIKICPLCGEKYSYIERRRTRHNTYIYYVHVKRINNKRKIKKCYAGAESCYKYVEKLHFDIEPHLRGIHDQSRTIDYLRAIIEYFNNLLLKKEYEKMDQKEKELLRELGKLLEEINWEISYILNQ